MQANRTWGEEWNPTPVLFFSFILFLLVGLTRQIDWGAQHRRIVSSQVLLLLWQGIDFVVSFIVKVFEVFSKELSLSLEFQ
jgi:hypothetical protein